MQNWLQKQIMLVRRNHALEHATIHILSRKLPGMHMIGRSGANGFWLYGAVPRSVLQESVEEALARLAAGEHTLAIHENCGTNIVAMSILAGVGGSIALSGRRKHGWWDRFNALTIIAMLSTFLGRPFGYWLQEHVTTVTDSSAGHVVAIEDKGQQGNTPVQFVHVQWSQS